MTRGRKRLDICCAWAETRRSVTLSSGQRAAVPPNSWIPVPATDSRSPALRRHWTPVSSTTVDEPHGYWSAAPSSGNAAPILERHWAPATPRENRDTNHNVQTVTPDRTSSTLLPQAEALLPAESMPASDETVSSPPLLSQTATPDRKSATLLSQVETLLRTESITAGDETVSIPPILSQTVTRLCVGCGLPLEGKRPQAKSHGAACRQRAYRRQKKAAADAQEQREAGHQAEPQQADLAHITIG